MKKKLEAELISIAHRILKLKNKAEIVQLQQETLKLYEKLSVLRFVEENFNDIKPTIGYASAEEKLEEVYGLEDGNTVHANEVEAQEENERPDKKTAAAQEDKPAAESPAVKGPFEENAQKQQQDKESDRGEGVDTAGTDESPTSEEEVNYTEQHTEEDVAPDNKDKQDEPKPATQPEPVEEPRKEPAPVEEPKEQPKAEEKPQSNFEQKAEEPKKQKEITFEDFHDYKEPEFVKKSDITNPVSINREFLPKEPEVIQKQEDHANEVAQPQRQEEPKAEPVRDWRDWEPSTSPAAAKPVHEERPVAARTINDSLGKSINLGLNDRIAFEKNLFGGSGEDLNRVLSQLNTFNTLSEARNFIEDMVKPDYNNWNGKEDYEERFMALVEKKFD